MGTCKTVLKETVEKLVQVVSLSKCSPNPQRTNSLLSFDYKISRMIITSCQYAQYRIIISCFFIVLSASYFLLCFQLHPLWTNWAIHLACSDNEFLRQILLSYKPQAIQNEGSDRIELNLTVRCNEILKRFFNSASTELFYEQWNYWRRLFSFYIWCPLPTPENTNSSLLPLTPLM